MKSLITVLTLFALLVSVPAFAQEHHMNMGADAIQFNITLSDYSFSVEGQDADQPLQLQSGQDYQLHFTNASTLMMAHEVLFGRNPTQYAGGFAHTYAEPLLSDVPTMLMSQTDGKDFMINTAGLNEFQLAAGQEMTIEFTLPDDKAGEWEMGCFEFLSMDNNEDNPGHTHYDLGMHLPIVVAMGMQM